MKGIPVGLDVVFTETEAPLELRLLVAMVADQIQSLGDLKRKGAWRNDPSEIGDWLRAHSLDRRKRKILMEEEAMEEWRLWGSWTDVLLEWCEENGIYLDRNRIKRLASMVAAGTWGQPRPGWN